MVDVRLSCGEKWAITALALCVSILCSGRNARGDESGPTEDQQIRHRLEAECLPAWRKYEPWLLSTQGHLEIDTTVWKNGIGKAYSPQYLQYWVCSGVGGIKTLDVGPDGTPIKGGHIFASNGENAFRIVRPESADRFKIVSFNADPGKPMVGSADEPALTNRAWSGVPLCAVLAGEVAGNDKLAWIVQGTECSSRLVSAEYDDSTGKRLIKLNTVEGWFSPKAGSKDCPATVWLDPARWAVVRTMCTHWVPGGTVTDESTVSYQSDVTEAPIPSRVVNTMSRATGEPIQRRTFILDRPEPCRASAKEFTLAGYGVREPGSVKGSNRFVIINGLILILIGVLYAVHQRVRRRRRPAGGTASADR